MFGQSSMRRRTHARKKGARQPPEEALRRWTAKRRAAVVVAIFKGRTSAAEISAKYGLCAEDIDEWKKHFLAGAVTALESKQSPSPEPVPVQPASAFRSPEDMMSPEERADAIAAILLKGVTRRIAKKQREKTRRWRERKAGKSAAPEEPDKSTNSRVRRRTT